MIMQDDPLDDLGATQKITHKRHHYSEPSPLIPRHSSDPLEARDQSCNPHHTPIPSSGLDEIFYLREPSLQNQCKGWKKKALQSHLTCDLHELTLVQAEKKVEDYLIKANSLGYSALLFIHGKARHSPVAALKSQLAGQLQSHPRVLAYWSAPASHGGTGALFCFIQNNKEDHV